MLPCAIRMSAAAALVMLAAVPALGQTQQQKDWCYKDSFTDD